MSRTTPQPSVFPSCSTCHCPYVLRRCHLITTGKSEWLWQRDCKHTAAVAVLDNGKTPNLKADS